MTTTRPGARITLITALLGLGILAGCNDSDSNRNTYVPPPVEPPVEPPVDPVLLGKEVFRFETFGNEGFWTDAMQLPQGIIAAELTPLQALGLGLSVNAESLEPVFAGVVVEQIQAALNGDDAPSLSDPATTLELIRQGAVIGVVPFGADGERLRRQRAVG